MNQVPAMRENFAVQHTNNFMPSMQELEQLGRLCHTLAQAPFYAKLGAGGVLAIWLTARELKLPPMMCLNGGLHNIEGKVSMSAQLMNMMIINAGHNIEVLYLTDQGCAIRFTRVYKTGKTKSDEYEFNMKDAHRAKYFGEQGPNGTMLSKPKANWVMYPRDMFFARALSGGAKKFLPEVMMNCYVFGEIEDAQAEEIQGSHEFVNNIVPTGEAPKAQIELPPVQPEPPKEPVKPVPTEQEICEFKEKFGIGTESLHEVYLEAICKKSKKNKDEMIVCAAMNEVGFIDAFNKWESGLKKKQEGNESPVGLAVS
jgi:hypothetical protein